jgi:hypothetical protein
MTLLLDHLETSRVDNIPIDPAGDRPRSGGDVDVSSLFSNIARRFLTPPLEDRA